MSIKMCRNSVDCVVVDAVITSCTYYSDITSTVSTVVDAVNKNYCQSNILKSERLRQLDSNHDRR